MSGLSGDHAVVSQQYIWDLPGIETLLANVRDLPGVVLGVLTVFVQV